MSSPEVALRDVIEQAVLEVEQLAAQINDPISRAWALETAAKSIPDAQHRIRRLRAGALREALATRKAADVAAEFGISRSRLYKILDGVDA